ncbi:MAG: YicC family protein [Chlorobi bacterium]|nr:YicC family protein [Chlorobiota bacterium]
MILSMTGFGRAEANGEGVTATVEMRSVNNRFLEVSARLPKEFNLRESDVKDILRKTFSRGKITLTVTLDRSKETDKVLDVNGALALKFKEALNTIRKEAKIKEAVSLSHLLFFKDELIRRDSNSDSVDHDWNVITVAIAKGAKSLNTMRVKEGKELAKDLRKRINELNKVVDKIESISKEQVPEERKRLHERIARLFENEEIDEQRLEMEVVILADKLDVTEECVRWKSHSKFFIEAINDKEPAGRRLNFLLQEMHREINTMGSKSSDSRIAHLVVKAKEELERIREQVQNIE